MVRKNRDYAAEYQRRISSHSGEGLSRSQLAGHPRKGERSITAIRNEPSPPPQPSREPTPLRPRTNKEITESWGGEYLKRNKFGFHGARFDDLETAIAFAESLPKDASFYITQFGTLIRQSPPPKKGEVSEIGEKRNRSLSMLMDKSFLSGGGDSDIRRKSAYLFDPTAGSEFTVLWRKEV